MTNAPARARKSVFELPIFANVDPDLLHKHVREEMVAAYDGDQIITHGRTPEAVYVIMDGSVDIYGVNEAGKEILIAQRGIDDVVGEQSLIDKPVTTADVRARGRVDALKLPKESFEALKTDVNFVWNLLEAVSAKLREATGTRTRHRLEQKMLLANFRAHVPKQFVDQILAGHEEAGTPKQRDAIVMFVDLRNFTASCAGMNPLDIARELAPFFDVIVDVVHKHNGIVDKYIGDAVMAVWGHPALPVPDANRVFDAVREMQAPAGLQFGGRAVRIGVGISSGSVFMGNVGTDDRQSFTVLGDPVNFAARYEALNKGKDGEFIMTVGLDFYQKLNRPNQEALEPRDHQPVKGAPGNEQTVYSMKRND